MFNFCNGFGQEGEFDTFKHGAAHGVIIGLFLVVPKYNNTFFYYKTVPNEFT